MNYFLSFLSSGSIVHRKSTYRPDYPRSIPDENEKSLNDRPRSCMAFQFGRRNKYCQSTRYRFFFGRKKNPLWLRWLIALDYRIDYWTGLFLEVVLASVMRNDHSPLNHFIFRLATVLYQNALKNALVVRCRAEFLNS